jgi:hypothetical protein
VTELEKPAAGKIQQRMRKRERIAAANTEKYGFHKQSGAKILWRLAVQEKQKDQEEA